MSSDIYVEDEPHQGNQYFSRIMRFRNNRVARFFADVHGGIYKGWVKGNTTSTSQEAQAPFLVKRKGVIL